jgi:hypothetical protein
MKKPNQVTDYVSASGRSLFRFEGAGDDDPMSMTPAGWLIWMLHMEPSGFSPGSTWRDRVMRYQKLAKAALAREVLRATPRPDDEVLCERFDVDTLRREIEAKGWDAAMEAFLDRLPSAD